VQVPCRISVIDVSMLVLLAVILRTFLVHVLVVLTGKMFGRARFTFDLTFLDSYNTSLVCISLRNLTYRNHDGHQNAFPEILA
jgi:hypothetical protein